LLGRLMKRRVFLWPEENQATIGELVENNVQQEARQRIETLNQSINLSPQKVLEKVRPRAESWQFGELLDHTEPGQSCLLMSF